MSSANLKRSHPEEGDESPAPEPPRQVSRLEGGGDAGAPLPPPQFEHAGMYAPQQPQPPPQQQPQAPASFPVKREPSFEVSPTSSHPPVALSEAARHNGTSGAAPMHTDADNGASHAEHMPAASERTYVPFKQQPHAQPGPTGIAQPQSFSQHSPSQATNAQPHALVHTTAQPLAQPATSPLQPSPQQTSSFQQPAQASAPHPTAFSQTQHTPSPQPQQLTQAQPQQPQQHAPTTVTHAPQTHTHMQQQQQAPTQQAHVVSQPQQQQPPQVAQPQAQGIPHHQPSQQVQPQVQAQQHVQAPTQQTPPPPPPQQQQQQQQQPQAQQQAAPAPAPRTLPKQNSEDMGQSPQPAGHQMPRLKVEDALSYLDKVKMQFQSKPHVYNQFLEIMKEFKSQHIDTPGVIQSVSELFEGHPDLIEGFNTFLPPGYKIEVPDHQQPKRIMVTQPGQPPQAHVSQSTMQFNRPQVVQPVVYQENGVAPHPPPPQEHAQQDPSKPLEFKHAIKYVNTIKTRFTDNLETYKAFLDILHTYQKDNKTIDEVYAQVAELFKDHPDLLDEFSQFLPEAVPAAQKHQENLRRQMAGKKASAGAAQKRPASEKAAVKKKAKEFGGYEELQGHGLVTEELAMFERIKKALKPQQIYDNFLRCLSLYSHEIIHRQELVTLVSGFLSKHPDLFQWFKDFVGFKEPQSEQPPAPEPHHREIDLTQCKQLDQSYRALPESYHNQKCTGRALLSKEIQKTLNDNWVSFPTWSDESTFATGKKNVNEEAIFRCEDERFELDIILEANLATIRVLETVLRDLEEKSPQDQKAYEFNTLTLGGTSEVIHRKAVQRLYGERTEEMLQLVKKSPLQHIPILLARLKQKHAEWTSTQRQWNEVWRETIEKNYLKSLDYKASNFKRVDPNNFKPKILRQKMKERREEYRKAREAAKGTKNYNSIKAPVISYTYDDLDLLKDVERLVLRALTKNATIAGADKPKITNILCKFLPQFLFSDGVVDVSYDPDILDGFTGEQQQQQQQQGSRQSREEEEEEEEEDEGRSSNGRRSKDPRDVEGGDGAASMDVDGAGEDGAGDSSNQGAEKAAETQEEKSARNLMSSLNSKISMDAVEVEAAKQAAAASSRVFWGNGKWFVFHSLHQLIYDRIKEMKKFSQELAASFKEPNPKSPSIALALRTPTDVKPENYYSTFLELCEQVIEGSLDAAAFEESMRELFNTRAYLVFTMERLVQTFVRELQYVLNDYSCQSLAGAYKRSQEDPSYNYREQVEKIFEGSNMYRIERLGPGSVVMELLDSGEIAAGGETDLDKWLRYIEEFNGKDITDPNLIPLMRNKVFLQRNKQRAPANTEDVTIKNSLEMKLPLNSYKILFVKNTEDCVFRHKEKKESGSDASSARFSKFRQNLAQWLERNTTPEDVEFAEKLLEGVAGQLSEASEVKDSAHHYRRFHTPNTAEPATVSSSEAVPMQ